MSGRFETAIRVQRRQVDEIRLSIGVEIERARLIQEARVQVEEAMARERALVFARSMISGEAWLARARAERERLANEEKLAEARLNQLRARAREVYGTMRAIEEAARRDREEAVRQADAAEQAALDDLAATRFARRPRRRPA